MFQTSGLALPLLLRLRRRPLPIVAAKFTEVSPALSPDGRWLAYSSNEIGEYEIYVVPLPNTGAAKWAVSTHTGGRSRFGPTCEDAAPKLTASLLSKSSNDYGRTTIAAMVSATMRALTLGPSQFA